MHFRSSMSAMAVVASLLLFVDHAGATLSRVNLDELYQEFYNVSNMDAVLKLLQDKLEEGDPDMGKIVGYLNSTDFRAINDHMWASRESQSFYNWLLVRQLEIDDFFAWLYDFLAWGEFTPRLDAVEDAVEGGGRWRRSIGSLVDEVQALIPFEQVLAWYFGRLTSDDMLVLMHKLHDESFHAVWRHLYDSTEFLEARCKLIVDEGFNIQEREQMLCGFLEWPEDDCQSPHCEGDGGGGQKAVGVKKTKAKTSRRKMTKSP